VVNDVSTNASLSGGSGRYTLSTAPSFGFIYIQKPDLEAGRQGLRSATRADGKTLNPANAWLSQTWDRVGLHWNYFVNLFDVNNTGGWPYTLQYQALPGMTNRPPKLDPINNWTIELGNFLSLPITAFDPDGNQLNYTMPSGPTNATLNPNTGLFSWRPVFRQAGTTNVIVVQVTDNGSPPLSDSTNFVVIVSPVQTFAISVGSTNILAGESNSVAIVLKSDLALTNVAWLFTPSVVGGLTNYALLNLAPEVFSYTFAPAGSNTYALAMEVDPLRIQNSTRQLALLAFQSPPGTHSAVVPLPATSLLGHDTDGKSITNGSYAAGRVVVFANEPVLEMNRDKTLTLYGRPGGSYSVETKLDFSISNTFAFLLHFPLTNRFWTFPVSAPVPSSFYRAYEFQADPPLLEYPTGVFNSAQLLIYGRPGANYTLDRAVSSGGLTSWVEVVTFTMTNSWQFVGLAPEMETSLFRVREHVIVPSRLDILSASGPVVRLRLQGKPGTNYVIEAKTQLTTNIAWVPVLSIIPTNASQIFSWTNTGPPSRFFRAVESGLITRPFLAVETISSQVARLCLDGLIGGLYLIESATNVLSSISWVPVQTVTLTNSSQRFNATNYGEPVRVFRARVN
jgi:hypothetical protein